MRPRLKTLLPFLQISLYFIWWEHIYVPPHLYEGVAGKGAGKQTGRRCCREGRGESESKSSDMATMPEVVVTYSYLLLYIVLSSGQIFFNKWVLSSKQINFPYPLALTLLHMVFSSILCFIVVKVLKLVRLQDGMTPEIYATSVFPIGAMFSMTLWLGNTAYLYISVAFAQMLKAIMPVAVFLLGAAAGLEVLSCKMFLIMSVISFGVLVASYGEINVSWVGVVYQMGGVIGEALRLIFMEILVKRKGLKLNPITLMYYVSPCSAICLFIPWIFLEKPKMDAETTWKFDPVVMSLNALCTFALNVSVFLVISHTSALTIRVAGVVKDWVVVLLSALLFADTKLTAINLFGYGVAIAGVAAYNSYKIKQEASRAKTTELVMDDISAKLHEGHEILRSNASVDGRYHDGNIDSDPGNVDEQGRP